MLGTDLLTFGVAAAVFVIAGKMRWLPAYFDNLVSRNLARKYLKKSVSGALNKKWALTEEILDKPVNLQQGILKGLPVNVIIKIVLTCVHRFNAQKKGFFLTFGVAAAVFGIAGGVCWLPAYFDNLVSRNVARKYLKKSVSGALNKKWALTEEILDMPVNLQQGILKDLPVKLLLKVLTCGHRFNAQNFFFWTFGVAASVFRIAGGMCCFFFFFYYY